MIRKDKQLTLKEISFWLNGNAVVLLVPPELTALELLNDKLALHGTKSSCNEGDCGACTVLIGLKQKKQVVYQAVNSCLYPAVRLHGKHLITVEGLTEKDKLHPIQTAMLDTHGTQCGFCTPGFVMSMLGLFLANPRPSKAEVLAALEGNLCRCTGYDSILQAALWLKKNLKHGVDLLPSKLRKVEKSLNSDVAVIQSLEGANLEAYTTRNFHTPKTLIELWKAMQKSSPEGYKFLAGGTDLQVLANIQHIRPVNLIDLSELKELQGIRLTGKSLWIGAGATLSEICTHKLVAKHFPLLLQAIEQMSSQQIRNSATLAGNIANASPVADGATTLLALEASVILVSCQQERTVKLSDFYHAYKQTELQPQEIIKAISLPLLAAAETYSDFLKSAKRKAVDISGVVSAFSAELKAGRISRAVLSFGGVAPYPALAIKTMAYLKGKKLEPGIVEQAASIAREEFRPISDVRGSEQYRSLLIQNHVLKHLNNLIRTMHPARRRSK
jgi:xanthine dehydrogenase small subunit